MHYAKCNEIGKSQDFTVFSISFPRFQGGSKSAKILGKSQVVIIYSGTCKCDEIISVLILFRTVFA